jgi:hypothetical protein
MAGLRGAFFDTRVLVAEVIELGRSWQHSAPWNLTGNADEWGPKA